MTVKELIAALQELPDQDAPVKVFAVCFEADGFDEIGVCVAGGYLLD